MGAIQFAFCLPFFIFLFSTKIFASSEDLGIDENKNDNIINSNNKNNIENNNNDIIGSNNNNNNDNDIINGSNSLNKTLKNERAGKSKQIIDDSFFQ
jgi:hypothetical protein